VRGRIDQQVTRFLLWRLLGLLALLLGLALVAWCLGGGPGRALRGRSSAVTAGHLLGDCSRVISAAWTAAIGAALPLAIAAALVFALSISILLVRMVARKRRRHVRMLVEPYRTDKAATPESCASGPTTST
jgi:hypothetical protein